MKARERKHTRQQTAHNSSDAVTSESIERIVIAETRFEESNRRIADGRSDGAHDGGGPKVDEACRRRDGDQSRKGTRARSDQGDFTSMNSLDKHPGKHGSSRGDHRVDQR